jgi:hypothetical protein
MVLLLLLARPDTVQDGLPLPLESRLSVLEEASFLLPDEKVSPVRATGDALTRFDDGEGLASGCDPAGTPVVAAVKADALLER